MPMLLRLLWWRIRYGVWYLDWRISFAIARGSTLHGVKVKLAPVLDEEIGTRALEKVEAALDLIAEHDPRRMSRIARDLRWIWIQRAAYAPAYFIKELRLCVLDRAYIVADSTPPAMIAVSIVHEAAHARLFSRDIPYPAPARPRIEAVCDAQSAEFARRLPDGEPLVRRILEGRPADVTHWSDDKLDRRMADAKHAEFEATRQELEASDLPAWLKRMLHKMIRSRAA